MQAFAAGERFGNYQVTGLVGVGGMGAVYRAVHPEIGKVVAIKVLRAELARDGDAVGRFFDEARAVNAIRHEGIVDIFDFGKRTDGIVYYVMEHLPGEDLARVMAREGRLAGARAVSIVRQVCGPLGAAHRRGIVHRDLKPQNLFLMPRGGEERVKVLDFGIAKLSRDSPARPDTTEGVVLGTVQYMSPEQARAEAVDGRTDVYALGCILYELLTGSLPLPAKNAVAALARLATDKIEAPSLRAPEAGIPPALDAAVLRALAKDPSERFSETEELADALAAIDLSGMPYAATRPAVSEPVDANAPTMNSVLPTPKPPTPVPAKAPTPPSVSAIPLAAAGGNFSDRITNPVAKAARAADKMTPPRAIPAATPAPSDSHRLLVAPPLPLIDADSERRIVRVALPIVGLMFFAALVLYFVPSGGNSIDRSELRGWLPLMGLDCALLAALMFAVVRTQQRSRARFLVNRALTLLGVSSFTVAVHLTGSLASYDILYYPLLVIVDRLRGDRALARVTLVASFVSFTGVVLAEQLGWLPYAPLYPGEFSSALVADRGLAGIVIGVVGGVLFLSYKLIDFLASRVQQREQELRTLGLGLQGRLEEQVELLRRSDDLRRYVSPQLAEAILRGEQAGAPGHERRRITVVRVDCPAIARAAESVEPEELAALLNDLFAKIADLAVACAGTVDRFSGAELSVMFGAPHTEGAATDALAAVRFAESAIPKVRELAMRCEAAGVEEPAEARAAVHTGFATVGSFGSPSRLEYTAIGPHVSAAAALLAEAPPGKVILTHSTLVLLRDKIAVEAAGERALPGARHPVKLYQLKASTIS
jgi:serine/threonine protein kinase/class 3 adenylate cyclase